MTARVWGDASGLPDEWRSSSENLGSSRVAWCTGTVMEVLVA